MAARALGVSPAALGRWIESGDLPVVLSAEGHLEVPVPALIDLRGSVDADRADGPRAMRSFRR
jgi:predicted site-specific integrase-resolvase